MIVTDGFTGNVALKTDRGRDPRHRAGSCSTTLATPEIKEAAEVVMPAPARGGRRSSTPTAIGGAVLLGVDGVCVDRARLVERHGHRELGGPRAWSACEQRRRRADRRRRCADAG